MLILIDRVHLYRFSLTLWMITILLHLTCRIKVRFSILMNVMMAHVTLGLTMCSVLESYPPWLQLLKQSGLVPHFLIM